MLSHLDTDPSRSGFTKLKISDVSVTCNATVDRSCNVWHYTYVEIESISHKALRHFVETGKAKGVIEPRRIQLMIALILNAESIEELKIPPNFGFHALSGDRDGAYSMTVTRNWRLTFRLAGDAAIADLDLEDYH
jgi:proteic killer suppression protein